ncbi:hypothetical protein SAMN05421664_3293 [Chryseobacterium soldanellicola]|uniref:C1q domain-containing protein n=1 Tax=Chryseobacterium soldanellicola TaxID=311333 RepID=A0A1H1FWH7_9FLAO|nr:hypothetical protein [Chryseobacterium soldanellicola]SDR05038.1 hypothetical protein SAMN05421664_3293 [Chryseobacterium soldanellicola]
MKKNSLLALIATLSSVLFYSQAGNVGINTSDPGSNLTVSGSFAATYRQASASGNVGINDYYVAYNGTTNGTLTLPAAINGSGNFIGRTYHFKNTGTATLSVAASGTELIDNQSGAGVSSVNVPPGYYAFFISKGTTTGTTWELILLSSSDSLPAAASTYAFSTVSTTTRQTLPATTGPYIGSEINYPQGTVINTGNALNTSNGRFTAPTNGYYMFYGSTQFDNSLISGTPTFNFAVLYLIKNFSTTPNNVLVQSFQPNPGTLVGVNVSCITYLNAGETVSMASVAAVSSGSVYQVVVSSLYGYKIAN